VYQERRPHRLASLLNRAQAALAARGIGPSRIVVLEVAQLVSQGMTNKEVAAQCWVSPRTVEFHLRNVFTKAGVTSRGALARLDLS
jgi:ATP/maltotriose-dependent transcriptional regulator MalT